MDVNSCCIEMVLDIYFRFSIHKNCNAKAAVIDILAISVSKLDILAEDVSIASVPAIEVFLLNISLAIFAALLIKFVMS